MTHMTQVIDLVVRPCATGQKALRRITPPPPPQKKYLIKVDKIESSSSLISQRGGENKEV